MSASRHTYAVLRYHNEDDDRLYDGNLCSLTGGIEDTDFSTGKKKVAEARRDWLAESYPKNYYRVVKLR
jgi:hypothetical protein